MPGPRRGRATEPCGPRPATCWRFVDDDVVLDRHWLRGLRRGVGRAPRRRGDDRPDPALRAGDRRRRWRSSGGAASGAATIQVRYEGLDRPGDPIYPYGPGMFGAGANMVGVRRSRRHAPGGLRRGPRHRPAAPRGRGHRPDAPGPAGRSGRSCTSLAAVVFHRHRRDGDGLRRQYDSWGRSLMAFATKTYRRDPSGRLKLRRLLRWFFRTQIREARRPPGWAPGDARTAALAELCGRGRRAGGHLRPIGPPDRPQAPSRPWASRRWRSCRGATWWRTTPARSA